MRLSRWRTLLPLCIAPFLPRPSFAASSAPTPLPTCIPQKSIPIHLPIHNVTLSDGTLRRGAAVSFGTPAQSLAFVIDLNYNNTYLKDGTFPGCSINYTRPQCSSEYGGKFDEAKSTTWSPSNSTAVGTVDVDTSDQEHDKWGTDTLFVNTTLSIPDFPVGFFENSQADSQNALGLGRNSTLLNALVSTGAIFSRTFSIFLGWTGAQTQYQTDGSLILGGYDSAKITGNNITLPFTVEDVCNSGLLISITDINMNLKNGSNVSIIGQSRGSAMRACVRPDFNLITLHEDIWGSFINATGVVELGPSTSMINLGGMMIPANGAYDADLTFSIYPGLDIRIPNHQLLVSDHEINSEGQEYPSNSAEVQLLIHSLQAITLNDMPLFGLPFLSSAYLIVHNDQQTFTLSQSQQSTTSNLIPIGPAICNNPAPSISASVPASQTPTPKSSKSSFGTPKGAIAGALVGGLATIAICVGVFFIQKKRRAVAEAEMMKYQTHSGDQVYTKCELPSDTQPRQEMPSDGVSRPGIAPYEMPVEMPVTRS